MRTLLLMNRTTHLDQNFGVVRTEADFQPYSQLSPGESPLVFTKTRESPRDPQDSCEGERIILGDSEVPGERWGLEGPTVPPGQRFTE